MHKILAKIITRKKEELRIGKKSDFKAAILKAQEVAIIGELKFASPTDSNIGLAETLSTHAKEYEKAGIAAISVIVEKHFFKGDIAFVSQVKKTVKIPVLQKDFVIDVSQIYQAKGAGADAILLIAGIVDGPTLQFFVSTAKKINIEPVVEIASGDDLEKAMQSKTDIIAVNARDLDTFEVDVNRTYAVIS